jgi:uncharacterized membrane protein
MDWIALLLRWFHVVTAIVWLGLHYYTDLIYSRARAAAADTGSSAILDNYVAVQLGHWMRTSALFCWIFGCGLLGTLSLPGHQGLVDAFLLRGIYAPIGIGAWLGTVMLAIAIGPMRTADVPAALAWARVNTVLSIPLVFFMVFGFSHQGIAGL